jgi:hypothetical protein
MNYTRAHYNEMVLRENGKMGWNHGIVDSWNFVNIMA